jgi:hypothetical protein
MSMGEFFYNYYGLNIFILTIKDSLMFNMSIDK